MLRALCPAVLACAASCANLERFECEFDAECVRDGAPGFCEASRACSFRDESCASLRRFGEFAGADSGECVGIDARLCAGEWSSFAPDDGSLLEAVNSDESEYSPYPSADGLELFFHRGDDLWVARRADPAAPFGEPTHIDELATESRERTPSLSADGLDLYFRSNRSGGSGSDDLWMASRPSRTEAFGAAVNLRRVNTAEGESSPSIAADGLALYFRREQSAALSDIFVATRDSVSDVFEDPVLVEPVSTSEDEGGPSISADGLELFYDRAVGGAEAQIYRASRESTEVPFSEGEDLQLYADVYADEEPEISADGRALYYIRFSAAQADIYRAIRTCDQRR